MKWVRRTSSSTWKIASCHPWTVELGTWHSAMQGSMRERKFMRWVLQCVRWRIFLGDWQIECELEREWFLFSFIVILVIFKWWEVQKSPQVITFYWCFNWANYLRTKTIDQKPNASILAKHHCVNLIQKLVKPLPLIHLTHLFLNLSKHSFECLNVLLQCQLIQRLITIVQTIPFTHVQWFLRLTVLTWLLLCHHMTTVVL